MIIAVDGAHLICNREAEVCDTVYKIGPSHRIKKQQKRHIELDIDMYRMFDLLLQNTMKWQYVNRISANVLYLRVCKFKSHDSNFQNRITILRKKKSEF